VKQENEVRKRRVAMTPQLLLVLLTFGAVLAIASLLLRSLTKGFEVQTIDLIFLIIPLLLVALATGNIKSLDIFGLKADFSFSDLWSEAAHTEIRNQISDSTLLDSMDELATAAEGSLQDLRQRLIGRQIEALVFKLGYDGYSGEAVKKYFEALSDSLRVVLVNDPEGKLFAFYNVPDLIRSLGSSEVKYRDLAQWLSNENQEDRSELAKLPGFVGADNAVKANTPKRDALMAMEKLNTDILPVVTEEGHFIGTVGRSKLTAGLILAVSAQLEDR
jgi:hypothetical protein